MVYTRVVLASIVAALPSVRAFGSLPSGGSVNAGAVNVGAETVQDDDQDDDPCVNIDDERYATDQGNYPSEYIDALAVMLDKGDETPCRCYQNLVEVPGNSECLTAMGLLNSNAKSTIGITADMVASNSLTSQWSKNPRPQFCHYIDDPSLAVHNNKVFFNLDDRGAGDKFSNFRKICAFASSQQDTCTALGDYMDDTYCGSGTSSNPRPVRPANTTALRDACNLRSATETQGLCTRPGDSCPCSKWDNEPPRGEGNGGCPVCLYHPHKANTLYTYQEEADGDYKVGYHTAGQCCMWTPKTS